MCRKMVFLITVALVLGWSAGSAMAALMAYYPFSEGQGTTTVNATGKGNDGTFNGAVEWVAGYKNGAVRFDTAGERIVIGPIDPSAGTNAMTLAAWIKWEGSGSATAHQGIVGKRLGWPSDGGTIKWFWQTTPTGDLLLRADYNGGGTSFGWGNGVIASYANQWVHVAVTWAAGTGIEYVNGKQVATGSVTFRDSANATPVAIGCTDSTNTESFVGVIDEVQIYDAALTPEELQLAMTSEFASTKSSSPSPSTGGTDVPRDVVLSWSPGQYAATHDVYFGTRFDDVNLATRDNPTGVMASQGQTATAYDPSGLLAFSQTYYWRVDEVNAAPDSSIHKGPTWLFTVEPVAYPVQPVKATASSSQAAAMGPDKTIGGIGLDASDQHSISTTQMWISKKGSGPIWIQYEFDTAYKLYQMWVWNSNQAIESIVGFGAKDVTIQTSLDGTTWTDVPNVPEFAQATGEPNYVHNTEVDLGGAFAKFVKLTINFNWADAKTQASLSEVRFFQMPMLAREPQPASGSVDVALDATLNWRPGRQAAEHQVFVSADAAAVTAGTAPVAKVTDHKLPLASSGLEFGKTYYWKVVEVNAAETPKSWEGPVWSFTTVQYAVAEDFEGYDDKCNRIFFAWVDGFGHSGSADCGVAPNSGNATGSTVGNINPPFAEQTVVHGGRQAMPMWFDNTKAPFYSEAQCDLKTPEVWTRGGANTLTVWVLGDAPAFLETSPGTILMNGTGTDVWDTSDQFRFVYKQLKGNGSIVARVDSVGNTNAWAKAGVMIRESTAAGSVHAFTAATPTSSHGVSFQYRNDTGVATNSNTDVANTPMPQWVKVTRNGTSFTAQYSADGKTWTDIVPTTAATITMASDVLIGLGVTSHAAGVACGAKFSNVSTTGTVSGQWQVAEVGAVQTGGNTPEAFYLVVQDGGGKSKVVSSADPMVIASGAWQQWNIPFSQFTSAGVNLGSIKRLTVGVGDRTTPKPGGTGKLYIDDIRITRTAP